MTDARDVPRIDSAVVQTLDMASCAVILKDMRAGRREPVRLVVIDRYAPREARGRVYTLEALSGPCEVVVVPADGRGGPALRLDPFLLAQV